MFFIGIFGIDEREKTIREFPNIVCPACGRLAMAVLIERFTCFHFFFLPLFRWNRRYFVHLRCCGAVYEAEADYAKELKAADGIDWSRLAKISGGFGGNFGDDYKTCAYCGREFDKSYTYCPYCGKKA